MTFERPRTTTSAEELLLRHLVGGSTTSVLMTDAYKFAMAQAGDPLREETFYLSFRRPGMYLVPFDLERLVLAMVPCAAAEDEKEILERQGHSLSDEMGQALDGDLEIWTAPKGSWVQEREPIVRITGPSFLVSWLESMVIWLQFPIQVATEAVTNQRRHYTCTCDDEAAIVRLTLDAVDLLATSVVEVDPHYARSVRNNALRIARTLGGSLDRVFEVGMRGATCMQMHRIALGELLDLQLAGTSNVYLASELGLVAVGTTGHEFQLRYESDAEAFRAIRDGRVAPPSYLFDTIDALAVGIPAAIEVLRESPPRRATVRFDSGDTRRQILAFYDAGVRPPFIFMDGMDDEKIAELVEMQAELDAYGDPWRFGVGGFLVARAARTDLTRDRVSAVYKLCETGARPVMKFSVPGKESIPGKPVSWRIGPLHRARSVIAQEGEHIAGGTRLASSMEGTTPPAHRGGPQLSLGTRALVEQLRETHLTSHIERARAPFQKTSEAATPTEGRQS